MDALSMIPVNNLQTATPEEGRQLAVRIARRIVSLRQSDAEKRRQIQDIYAGDLLALIAIGQTVAQEFATIAAANNYWRRQERER